MVKNTAGVRDIFTLLGKFLPVLWFGSKKVTYWKGAKREAEILLSADEGKKLEIEQT